MDDIDAINSNLEETSFLMRRSNDSIGSLMKFGKEWKREKLGDVTSIINHRYDRLYVKIILEKQCKVFSKKL